MKRIGTLTLLAVLLAGSQTSALACAVCFGKSDSAMAQGMNAGIFALLFVIVSVLGGVASFFVYLVRRSTIGANNHSLPVEFPAQLHAETEKA